MQVAEVAHRELSVRVRFVGWQIWNWFVAYAYRKLGYSYEE
jgi:hypothetical protein